jgi:nitroreductase
MTAAGTSDILFEAGNTLMHVLSSRRTVLPKRLVAPGPNASQLATLFEAAATAPDHDQLLPWRFVIFPETTREKLGELFAQALYERDAHATPEQMNQAREKALRSPLLMLLVVNAACGTEDVDLNERVLSAGCAVQNILMAATAMGFGSSLTSGKAMKSPSFRQALRLSDADHAICFINVGSIDTVKQGKLRPQSTQFISTWTPAP